MHLTVDCGKVAQLWGDLSLGLADWIAVALIALSAVIIIAVDSKRGKNNVLFFALLGMLAVLMLLGFSGVSR